MVRRPLIRTLAMAGGLTLGTGGVPAGYVLLTDIDGQPLTDIFGAYMWGLA